MKLHVIALTTALALPGLASAGTVNLSGWTSDEASGSGAANWQVQGAEQDSVLQTNNSRPSVFYESGSTAQGKSLAGQITVEQTYGDDDFIGFVLGFNDDELKSDFSDFWLIDWKQRDQGNAKAGLSLSHVDGATVFANELNFWEHTGVVNEVQRATTLGSTGWQNQTLYDFELIFTADLIEVKVNGQTELSYTSADNGGVQFADGSFGFYNYSQANVSYVGITEGVAPVPVSPVPLPASLPLVLAGLTAFGLVRRRKA